VSDAATGVRHFFLLGQEGAYVRKLSLCVLLTACLAGHSLSARNFFDYADGLGPGNLLINAGLGFGVSAYGLGMPLSASVDYLNTLIGMSMSFGGLIGFATFYPMAEGSISHEVLMLGARLGWHFNLGEGAGDIYGTLTAGYIFSVNAESSNYKAPASESFLLGLTVGVRNFFTDVIGVYLEGGYSNFSFLSLGLTVKLGRSSGISQRAASQASLNSVSPENDVYNLDTRGNRSFL
jgi:hypothetical protein